jgi:hypothetical protein
VDGDTVLLSDMREVIEFCRAGTGRLPDFAYLFDLERHLLMPVGWMRIGPGREEAKGRPRRSVLCR